MANAQTSREVPLPLHICYQTQYPNVILKKRTMDAYASVIRFLTECTDWKGVWPEGEITVSGPDEFIPESLGSNQARKALSEILGSGQSAGITNNITTGESRSSGDKWVVPQSMHDQIVRFVDALPKADRGSPPAVSYAVSDAFRLRSPPRGAVLAGQSEDGSWYREEIRSNILLFVDGGAMSAYFHFAFPFEQPNEDFFSYVAAIRPYLSIKLSKSCFRHCVPNKKGTGYIRRRISAGLFSNLK